MTRFPLTLATISAATFFAILTLILGACLLPSVLPRAPSNPPAVESPPGLPLEDTHELVPKAEEEEKSKRRRRRHRRRDHSQDVSLYVLFA